MQVIYLSSVPMSNLGEGQRVPQLLGRLSELDGIKTHFVDTITYTQGKRIFLQQKVDNVIEFAVKTREKVVVVLTAPIPEYLPVLDSDYSQVKVVYDRFDAWNLFPANEGVGAWYDCDVERTIMERSDGVTASFISPFNLYAKEFLHLPNAASDAPLWPKRKFANRWANDYASGADSVYVGALDDRYINTSLLQRAGGRTIVCGCPPGRHSVPSNGLRPESYGTSTLLGWTDHRHLSFAFSNCALGLAPFQRISLSDNVDPIKVYEYLLAGLRPLVMGASLTEGYPWVIYEDNEDTFLSITRHPRDYALSEKQRVDARAWVEESHTWSVRARQLKAWFETF